MNNPESNQELVHLGIAPEDLTDEMWRGLVKIYYDVTCDRKVDDTQLERYHYANEALDMPAGGLRYGSKFSMHSKLTIELEQTPISPVLRFGFYVNSENPNHHDPTTKQGQEVVEVTETLKQKIDDYLLEHNVGKPLI